MPPAGYLSQLWTQHTITRWMRDVHRTPAVKRERALAERYPEIAHELDELCGQHMIEEQERLLLFVGTLLARRKQGELWRRIYRVVTDDPTRGGALAFLERTTARARAGDL